MLMSFPRRVILPYAGERLSYRNSDFPLYPHSLPSGNAPVFDCVENYWLELESNFINYSDFLHDAYNLAEKHSIKSEITYLKEDSKSNQKDHFTLVWNGIPCTPTLSCVRLFVTPWTTAHQDSLSTISQSLLKLMSIESVMPSNHLTLCHSLLLLPSIFPSIKVFSNELALHIRWPKYWNFSFNISPSNEYSGLISFRMDWLDLLAVQGTLKSFLQHHSSKASILHTQPSSQSNSHIHT